MSHELTERVPARLFRASKTLHGSCVQEMDTDLQRQLVRYGERTGTRGDYKEIAAHTEKQHDILLSLVQKVIHGQHEEVRMTAPVMLHVTSSGPADSRLRTVASLEKAAIFF